MTLMKALEEAQQRLIIVTSWLSKYSINKEILYKCAIAHGLCWAVTTF
ncbi:MAG: hypothetical protein PUP92_11130 [Rhizonema sp. PD38]|nr:hypothetical protein [Rhizonema sp. PD38]